MMIFGKDHTFLTTLNPTAEAPMPSLQSQMSIRQNEEPELYQSSNLSNKLNRTSLATDKAVKDDNNMSAISSEAEETLDEIRVSVNNTISKHAS